MMNQDALVDMVQRSTVARNTACPVYNHIMGLMDISMYLRHKTAKLRDVLLYISVDIQSHPVVQIT